MLDVKIEELDDSVVLHCVGQIVRGDETALLCAALRHFGRKIFLDLSQVNAIDTVGVGGLISLLAAGIYLHLMNPTEAVREALRVTKLESIFEICNASWTSTYRNHKDTRPSVGSFPLPVVVPAT